MQAIVDIRWLVACLAGLIATLVLFIALPGLAYNQPDPQSSVITVDFRDWNPEFPPAVDPPKKMRAIKKTAVAPKALPLTQAEPTQVPIPAETLTVPEQTPLLDPEPQAATVPSMPANVVPVPVPLFRLTAMPRFAHKELPVYPSDMLRGGKEAVVQLEVLIDKEGKVREITILHSAGESFDEAAKYAIRNSTFIPGQVAGEAVASLYRAPVTFKLR